MYSYSLALILSNSYLVSHANQDVAVVKSEITAGVNSIYNHTTQRETKNCNHCCHQYIKTVLGFLRHTRQKTVIIELYSGPSLIWHMKKPLSKSVLVTRTMQTGGISRYRGKLIYFRWLDQKSTKSLVYLVKGKYLTARVGHEKHAILMEYDDIIKWKHFPRCWLFVRGIHRQSVNYPHKGQWRWTWMFPSIFAWINGWVSNPEAGDLRRQRAHFDVTVIELSFFYSKLPVVWQIPCNFCKANHEKLNVLKLCYTFQSRVYPRRSWFP